ncbi:hypothetical protein BDV09DRAFT_192872 [Aspergillus tetrazonus]
MGRALPIFVDGELQMSKRTPDLCTADNSADTLERLMEADKFSRWGFAIYRCTYESDAEWDAFMARLYDSVTELLELDNGLDILDSYAPTVLQDPSFTDATTATLQMKTKNIRVPLEGSTTKDVGWMNVLYDDAQLMAYLNIQRDWDWEDYYERPAILAID